MSVLLLCLLVVTVVKRSSTVPPSLSSLRHCLSSTISSPRSLFVISLTDLFTQVFCLSLLFFLPLTLSHFSARGPASPHTPPSRPPRLSLRLFLCSWSFSPCESHQRGAETEPDVSLMNEVMQAPQTLLCWVTIRSLSLLSLCHTHLSLTSLSYTHTVQSKFRQIVLSACFCWAILTSRDSSEV